jgi:heptosyltransferase I
MTLPPPSRILIIKPSALGDIVHALPVLALLRSHFPAAHIAWLVSTAFQGIIAGHPHLSDVIPYRGRNFREVGNSPGAVLGEILSLPFHLRRMNFDTVLDLQGLARSAVLTFATGAPRRIGFREAREAAPLAYTHRVPQRAQGRHAVERYLDLLEPLGLPRGPVQFTFPSAPGDADELSDLLDTGRPFALLVPGTQWDTKKWPASRYLALAGLIRKELGLTIVAAGTGEEEGLCARLEPEVNLAGRLPLRLLPALIRSATVTITNDSGPMHIAAALGRPLVSLFGPTNPDLTGPYGSPLSVLRLPLPCAPCHSRSCSHGSCLAWIDEGTVLARVRAVLAR